ncbi:MAG: hypothetical protein DRQ45_03505 [Gammaproteobacteria bacterium]|nr:MAG: hypothetical protein DRQ45_03505 [Gammaproteobacteria bacterium]
MARLKEPNQLPSEAKRLKDRIRKDSARYPRKQCRKCQRGHFHWHAQCLKWILVVLDGVVYALRCVIYRWKCVHCGTTFRHLPSMCVRFKRYLRAEIERRASAYVEADPISYRKVVTDGGAALVYDAPIAGAQSTEAEKEDEHVPQMSHSTPHRWIGTIAAGREQFQSVVKQAQKTEAAGRLSSITISPLKYRREARKLVLQSCSLLLRAVQALALRNPTDLETLGSSP